MSITSSLELADVIFLVAIVVSVIVTFLSRVWQWEKRRGLDPARGREQWLGVSRHLGLSPRDLHPDHVHLTGAYRGIELELRSRTLGREESKHRVSWEAELELNLRWLGLDELKERIYIERSTVDERPSLPEFDDYFVYVEPEDPAVAEALHSESLRTALLRAGRRATRLRITKARLHVVRHHDVKGIEGFEAFVEQVVALAIELNEALPPGEVPTEGEAADLEGEPAASQTSTQPNYW